MKNKHLEILIIFVDALIITTFLLSGCSKQSNKETNGNKHDKTETLVLQNNSEKNDSIKENHSYIDTSKVQKTKELQYERDQAKENQVSFVHKTINIPSAQCDVCKGKISAAIKKIKGVKSFEVDIENHIVHLIFDSTRTTLGQIENAITKAGYDANNKKADPEAYAKLDKCCKKPEDRK